VYQEKLTLRELQWLKEAITMERIELERLYDKFKREGSPLQEELKQEIEEVGKLHRKFTFLLDYLYGAKQPKIVISVSREGASQLGEHLS